MAQFISIANEAAEIHAFMVNHPACGYSWSPRWGEDGWDEEFTSSSGRTYIVRVGSYDCSSSFIYAWRLALSYTDKAGALDAATYTGNIRSVFLGSGLFSDQSPSYIAGRGDAYLNEAEHVTMCQSQVPDLMSSFNINEFGGVYNGEFGDQTDHESDIQPFYEFANVIMHYEGALDGGAEDGGQIDPTPTIGEDQWQGDVVGCSDTTGAGDDYAGVYGERILYVAIDGVGPYQAHPLGHAPENWLETVDHYDLSDTEYGMAGDGRPIDGLRILDPSVCYQVRTEDGEWHETMRGTSDSSEVGDDYAGVYGLAIDAIRIWRDEGEQPRYNVFS